MWWIFVILGILLIAMEVLTPGFVVMWFGIAFIVSAIPAYFQASLEIILLTYAFTLFILTVFVRKIFVSRFLHKKDIRTNASSLIGERAVVTEIIDSIQATGRVRVRKEIWTAQAKDGHVIAEGQTVIVRSLDGVKLIVEKE